MTIAIIGGSGFTQLAGFTLRETHHVDTAYGQPSAPIVQGEMNGQELFFLARHGEQHAIQPHQINYRANIAALAELDITKVIALAAVGGIAQNCQPGALIMPEQILDYTSGRDHTFFDQEGDVAHAEFTEPYDASLRLACRQAAQAANVALIDGGTYAATQGPRFETRAEIQRYKKDGATIVGMTAMPEAVLAREKSMAYMTLASSVNYAAGIQAGTISHEQIHQAYTLASDKLYALLPQFLTLAKELTVTVPDLIRP